MFLFNGQYGVVSDDNGLYYMRARYYNVSIKRFINQDIVTGKLAESQSLNRYAYVEGNPVSYLDPFGLEKSATSEMRESLSKIKEVLNYLNAAAVIATCFFPEAIVVVKAISTISNFVTAFEIVLYGIDMYNAEVGSEQWFEALRGIAYSVLGSAIGKKFDNLFEDSLTKDSVIEGIKWIVEQIVSKYSEIVEDYALCEKV